MPVAASYMFDIWHRLPHTIIRVFRSSSGHYFRSRPFVVTMSLSEDSSGQGALTPIRRGDRNLERDALTRTGLNDEDRVILTVLDAPFDGKPAELALRVRMRDGWADMLDSLPPQTGSTGRIYRYNPPIWNSRIQYKRDAFYAAFAEHLERAYNLRLPYDKRNAFFESKKQDYLMNDVGRIVRQWTQTSDINIWDGWISTKTAFAYFERAKVSLYGTRLACFRIGDDKLVGGTRILSAVVISSS
jgi:hypothetical protein